MNPVLQHRQQDAVELFNGFGGAVKNPHQFFAPLLQCIVMSDYVFGYLILKVEYQLIFGTLGVDM